MKLEGKKAIVTGAAKGMGAAITTTLAGEGADVVSIPIHRAPFGRPAGERARPRFVLHGHQCGHPGRDFRIPARSRSFQARSKFRSSREPPAMSRTGTVALPARRHARSMAHVAAARIHEVHEQRDDRTAVVTRDLAHLPIHLGTQRLVELGLRQQQQLVEAVFQCASFQGASALYARVNMLSGVGRAPHLTNTNGFFSQTFDQ